MLAGEERNALLADAAEFGDFLGRLGRVQVIEPDLAAEVLTDMPTIQKRIVGVANQPPGHMPRHRQSSRDLGDAQPAGQFAQRRFFGFFTNHVDN